MRIEQNKENVIKSPYRATLTETSFIFILVVSWGWLFQWIILRASFRFLLSKSHRPCEKKEVRTKLRCYLWCRWMVSVEFAKKNISINERTVEGRYQSQRTITFSRWFSVMIIERIDWLHSMNRYAPYKTMLTEVIFHCILVTFVEKRVTSWPIRRFHAVC